MKLTVVQMEAFPSVEENFNTIVRTAGSAGNSDLLVYPELADIGYDIENAGSLKESPWKSCQDRLSKIMQNRTSEILIGGTELCGSRLYNSVYSVSNKRDPAFIYRKRALFGNENGIFTAGSDNSVLEMNGCSVGIHVCFDLRFPELFFYPDVYPEIQTVSAAWPASRIDIWKKLLTARAVENQCYVAASNLAGEASGIRFGGTSLIITPFGEIAAEAPIEGEAVLTAEADLESVKKLRTSIPVHSLRSSFITRP